YRLADRTGFSFEIYKRARTRVGCVGTCPRSPAKTGVCAPGFILIIWCIRPLPAAADKLEPATCLDHACASAIAGKSRAWLWFSSGRGPFVSGPAFSGLLAFSVF